MNSDDKLPHLTRSTISWVCLPHLFQLAEGWNLIDSFYFVFSYCSNVTSFGDGVCGRVNPALSSHQISDGIWWQNPKKHILVCMRICLIEDKIPHKWVAFQHPLPVWAGSITSKFMARESAIHALTYYPQWHHLRSLSIAAWVHTACIHLPYAEAEGLSFWVVLMRNYRK